MSVLVVEVLSEGIIFGADRNVTTEYGNGTTRQDEARPKVMKWPTNEFLFGSVGVATVGGLPINEWLIAQKDDFEAIGSLEGIAQELHKRVQEQRAEDEGGKSAEGLIIHVGGFEKKNEFWLPYVWHISNCYKLGQFGYLPDFRKEFICSEAFWKVAEKIDPLEIRSYLRVLEKQFTPVWFHQGIDLSTFNALESAIRSSFKLLCERHPNHDIPNTIEGWAKHIKMQILMYGAYFEAFHPEGERYVGGGADVIFAPWPD